MNPLQPHHDQCMARVRLSLLGLSVGDAFGEQFFGKPAVIQSRIAGRVIPDGPWPYTDDTEMALSIVEVLGDYGSIDQDRLADAFARRYDPRRAYGSMANVILKTIRSGRSWRDTSSSVFGGQGSMGNGGAMRVAPVGAYFADDLQRAAAEAALSVEVTHSHPEGQAGAIAVAVAAATAWRERDNLQHDPLSFIRTIMEYTPAGATRDGLEKAVRLPEDVTISTAAAVLGNGSRVTAPDTVPFTIWCAARFRGSYEEALWHTVSAFGDRDTTCAIVGGIVVLATGAKGIPEAWVNSREPLPEG